MSAQVVGGRLDSGHHGRELDELDERLALSR
jgi:hypothetical protein